MDIIVDFRIIFTLSGVGGNSDSRLSRRAVAIRRSLLQNKCKLNCIFHYNMVTKDDHEAYTVALVQAAIDLYKSEGIEAVATYHNDPANIDGQWYVFVTDENDIFVAHAQSSALVGTDLKDVPGLDGSTLGVDIASATETGSWIEYLWPNPDTNKLEQKRTWSIRHDGYLFASGYYEAWKPDPATLPVVSKDDPVAFTHDMVLKAIARYEFEGRDAVAAYYNMEESIDGQWYVFITD